MKKDDKIFFKNTKYILQLTLKVARCRPNHIKKKACVDTKNKCHTTLPERSGFVVTLEVLTKLICLCLAFFDSTILTEHTIITNIKISNNISHPFI